MQLIMLILPTSSSQGRCEVLECFPKTRPLLQLSGLFLRPCCMFQAILYGRCTREADPSLGVTPLLPAGRAASKVVLRHFWGRRIRPFFEEGCRMVHAACFPKIKANSHIESAWCTLPVQTCVAPGRLQKSLGPFWGPACPGKCPQTVSPDSVTRRGHSRDTFWTVPSAGPEGPQRHPMGHSLKHPRFRETLGDASQDTSASKGPRDSCRGSGGYASLDSAFLWHCL